MTDSAFNLLTVFKKLVGKSNFRHIVLATTGWEAQSEKEYLEYLVREEQLRTEDRLWGSMIEKDARAVRIGSKVSFVLNFLFIVLDDDGVVLDIQRELVDEHRELRDTTAGTAMSDELREERDQALQFAILKYAKLGSDEGSSREVERDFGENITPKDETAKILRRENKQAP
jgi:hypothetical protein